MMANEQPELTFFRDWASLDRRLQELAERLTRRFPGYMDAAAAHHGDREATDRALLADGTFQETELLAEYAAAFALEVPDEEVLPEPERFPGLSAEYLARYGCLPAEWDDDEVRLYISNPYELGRHVHFLRKHLHCACAVLPVRRAWLERVITKVAQEDETPDGAIDSEDENALRSLAGEARIVRLVNDIFQRAIELGASDIHVEPGETAVSVRCRVDGVLTEIISAPIRDFPAISSRIKLISGLNIAESRLPQDGRTTFQLGRTELDMRVSTIPILTGESIVLRLLNKASVAYDLHALGMSDEILAQFHELIQIPHGMILVVGPTGSGKTTTLYSVIHQLNDQKKKIITVEDPVEYQMAGLCQMQVNAKIGVTFASGLRSIVRQDPDIILVGEIRDRETADIAINAALTGHLVLSTLHTNDAVGAVTRLIDMGMEGFLVASALFGVMSQRLVRKVCPVCRGTGSDPANPGARCRNCNATGFRGRSGIYELLRVNDELREAITHNRPSSELEKIAVANGMKTLLEDGRAKVAAGITTQEELLRSTAEG